MHVTRILLGLSAFAGSALAQTSTSSTLNLFVLSVPTSLPTVWASVMTADATSTAYFLSCFGGAGTIYLDDDLNGCALIGGASVTVAPTAVQLHMVKEAESVSGSGVGTFTAEYFSTTTATASCGITSNTASCTGVVTSAITSRNVSSTGTELISTVIANASGNVVPMTITAGLEKLSTSTTASSSISTGGIGSRMTQHAGLVGVAAAVAGVAFL